MKRADVWMLVTETVYLKGFGNTFIKSGNKVVSIAVESNTGRVSNGVNRQKSEKDTRILFSIASVLRDIKMNR